MINKQTSNGVSLMPCPFCGGKADTKCTEGDYPDWHAECLECGASADIEGPYSFHHWNRRAAQSRGEVERLENDRAEQWRLRREAEAGRDTNAAVIAELRAQLAERDALLRDRMIARTCELSVQLDEAHALLREIEGCPWVVDEATIPRAGIEAAPQQVVGTMHVGLIRLRKIRAALSTSAEPKPRSEQPISAPKPPPTITVRDHRDDQSALALILQEELDRPRGFTD